jgi:catechol 2,3-dioxygenase-like lactoylglutathione lyase family enzyme
MRLAHLTYLVHDYDDAIAYFTRVLAFEVFEDADLGNGKRWVLIGPRGGEAKLLLAKAATPEQAAFVGKQGGGRVFLFLHTDDFARDHALFKSRGVRFVEEPRHEPYGTVTVFEDLYGNRWDLIGPKSAQTVLDL